MKKDIASDPHAEFRDDPEYMKLTLENHTKWFTVDGTEWCVTATKGSAINETKVAEYVDYQAPSGMKREMVTRKVYEGATDDLEGALDRYFSECEPELEQARRQA